VVVVLVVEYSRRGLVDDIANWYELNVSIGYSSIRVHV